MFAALSSAGRAQGRFSWRHLMPVSQCDLDQAVSRVVECEVAIAQQLQLIEELKRSNKHLGASENILQALNLALLNLCEMRDTIAREVV
jgi:hypothetical protein